LNCIFPLAGRIKQLKGKFSDQLKHIEATRDVEKPQDPEKGDKLKKAPVLVVVATEDPPDPQLSNQGRGGPGAGTLLIHETVIFAGSGFPKMGGMLSLIRIFCKTSAVFPHASLIRYVLMTVPEQPGFAESPINETVTTPPQLSASPSTRLILAAGLSA
jgi:hypothetical protein